MVLLALAFTVPGVLLLRALRLRGRAVREYPVFVPAAALAVLLAAGLFANLVGPQVGISAPLHGNTTALTVIGASLILWLIGLPAPSAARLPWRLAAANPGSLAPLILPLIAAAGALLMSHDHGTGVARAGQILVALTLLVGLPLSSRLTRGQVAMLLFGCALAAEWAFTLRSQEVVGYDITSELRIAQHIQAVGIWHPFNRNNAYGAMLSITVLPSTIASLTGCSPLICFKVVYPVVAALLPLSVFFIGERLMRRSYAAGAASLLIVQAYFFQQLPQLARQEIALLLFAAFIGTLVADRIRLGPRLALITVFGAGVVVSHYSSTYLAIPIVLASLILSMLLAHFRRPAMAGRLLWAAVVLIGGAVLWYGALTHSASNLTSFRASLEKNGFEILPNSTGSIVTRYLNGTEAVVVPAQKYESYAVKSYAGRSGYIDPLPAAREARYSLQPATVAVSKARLPALSKGLQWISIVFNELMLVLGVLGATAMIFWRRGSLLTRQIGILAFSTVGVLVLIRLSANIAAFYNQTRALDQSLLLLALPAGWLVQQALDRIRWLRVPAIAGLIVAFPFMFAFDSSLTALLTGGGTLLNLSQSGDDYQQDYMTPAELAGATWATSASQRHLLYTDPYGQLRLNATTGAVGLNQVTPETLDRHAWVFGTRTNVVLGTTRGAAGNVTATWAWPNQFLDRFYDTMYSNGDSAVYHR
jgi:hypothetical protein